MKVGFFISNSLSRREKEILFKNDFFKKVCHLLGFWKYLADEDKGKYKNVVKKLRNDIWELKPTQTLRLGGYFNDAEFIVCMILIKKRNKWNPQDIQTLEKRIKREKSIK